MRYSKLLVTVGALAVLTVFGCGRQESDVPAPDPIIQPPHADPAPQADPAMQTQMQTHTFTAQLSGTSGPAPGDPEGSGSAQFAIDAGSGEVCYELTVQNIDPATMAHIHIGGPDEAGGVVVPLEAPTEGRSAGCVMAPLDVAAAIIENPGAYYVNVHNESFPPGAIRGQLTQ
jgi:hypothetical protein